MTKGKSDIRSLTGLRGLAACWVIAYHAHEHEQARGPLAIMLHHGYLAVDVFFVLSGFVMALSYQGLFSRGITARACLTFALRRVARVYPLYIFVTLILTILFVHYVLVTGKPWRWFADMLSYNVVLLQSWGFGNGIIGQSWSVSTEMAAYALFPWLLLLTVDAGALVASVAGGLCYLAVLLVAYHPLGASPPFRAGPLDVYWAHSAWPLIRCVAEFTMGLLAFRVAERRLAPFRSAAFGYAVAAAALLLLAVPNSDVAFSALCPLILLALANEHHPVSRLFASVPALALGRWSYALYLIHYRLGAIRPHATAMAARHLPPLAAATFAEVLYWAVILVGAALCYRYIEVPGRRSLRGLEARLFPAEDRALQASEIEGRHAVR